MDMNDKDFEIIEKAAVEHFNGGNITVKCPRCGGEIVVNEYGTSYEVKCVNGCISDAIRGI